MSIHFKSLASRKDIVGSLGRGAIGLLGGSLQDNDSEQFIDNSKRKKFNITNGTLNFARYTRRTIAKPKEPFLPTHRQK
jgi:hypothetical protein